MSTTQWLVLGLIIVVLGGAIVWGMTGSDGGGNGDGGSTKAASLSSPEMALSIDMTSAAPTEPSDVFKTDTPIIYCTVKLSDGTPKTRMKGEWVYLGTGAEDAGRDKIYETEGTFSGTRYVAFSLTDDQGFKPGFYEVVLYLDGKEKFRVPFSVE